MQCYRTLRDNTGGMEERLLASVTVRLPVISSDGFCCGRTHVVVDYMTYITMITLRIFVYLRHREREKATHMGERCKMNIMGDRTGVCD